MVQIRLLDYLNMTLCRGGKCYWDAHTALHNPLPRKIILVKFTLVIIFQVHVSSGSGPTGQREAQSKFRTVLMWQAQAAPAAHKRSSDPGMKREWKVKLAWHKRTANCTE